MIDLTAARATAELLTDLIAGQQPAIDPRPYRPTRFTLKGCALTISFAE
jgi:glycine/D-amino acid oxidase-like deaminating enzyme